MEAEIATFKDITGRCQLDEWEQTANESKLHRLDVQSCYMSISNVKSILLLGKEIYHFCLFFLTHSSPAES